MSALELDNHDEIEGFNDLSTEQQKDLLEAVAETYDESKLIPHEEVMKRLLSGMKRIPVPVDNVIIDRSESYDDDRF
jgi:F0F1-type ATP synthase delta subunit